MVPLNKELIVCVTKTDNAKEDKAYKQTQCTKMEHIDLNVKWSRDCLR
jgi:hypothetical protein